MNRFLATIFLVSAAGTCMAADFSDQITWYQGPFTTKSIISNMTVTSLGMLNGVFEAPDTQFQMNGDNFKAVTTGPNDYRYEGTISQANGYNSEWQIVPQPAFRFSAAAYSVSVPGEYTVTIPQGAFSVNGQSNDEFSVVFTIADNRTYLPVDLGFQISPNPVSEVSELHDVLLTFNNLDAEGKRLYMDLGASPIIKPTITKDGTENAVECGFMGVGTTTGNLAYKMTIPDGALDGAGKYTVTIPEGAIRLSGANNSNYYTNTATTFTYTYVGTGSQDVDISQDVTWYYGTSFDRKLPVNGTLQSLSMLYGLLENGQVVRVKSGRPHATVTGPEGYSYNPEIIQSRAMNYVTQEVEDQNGFQLNCSQGAGSLSVPGDYVVTIPQGVLSVDGYDNAEFTATFTVKDTRNYIPTDFNFDVRPNPDDPELIALTYFNVSMSRLNAEGQVAYHSLGVKYGATATIAKTGGETVVLTFKTNEQVTTDMLSYKILFPDNLSFKNGTYTVTIPEGSMLIGSEDGAGYYTNKELQYVYEFEGSQGHTYTSTRPIVRPEQGTVKGIAGVQFESPDPALEMILNEGVNSFQVTMPDGTTADYEVLTYPSNILMNIPFYTTFTEPGQYKFTVPRDAFKYVDINNGDEYYTTGFDLVYEVTGGQVVDMDYQLAGTSGPLNKDYNEVYKLDYVYLTFNESVSPVDMIYSKVEYPDGSVHYARTTWSGANKRFMINFLDPVFPTLHGIYKVTVPEGICYNENGDFNKAFTFEMNYLDRAVVDINCTVDPENNSIVPKLSTITLIAPEDYKSISPVNGGITMTYFYNNDDPENRSMYYLSVINDTRMQIVLDNEVTEVGDYTWYIPSGAVDGTKNDGTQVMGNAMTFFWSIRESGVVTPVGDGADTQFTVYTLDGTLVMDKVNANELNRLGKGVYVINGRTYIIR